MFLAAAGLLAAATPAAARDIMVGAGQEYPSPSAAARAAGTGDHVHILAGTYYDCATWHGDHMVIEGAGPDTVMTDSACSGKASFVIDGQDTTVRDMTFARVRVPDENGAGIRAEGPDLLVERVRFTDDQDGILAGSQPHGTIQVIDCRFDAIGSPGSSHESAALVIGAMDRLVVRNATIADPRAGGGIISHAALTEVSGSHIATNGGPSVQASGGLSVTGSTLQAGLVGGYRAAVLAFPAAAGAPLTLRQDVVDGTGPLLLNWSGRTATLDGNTLGPDGVGESTAGAWSFRTRQAAHHTYDDLHDTAKDFAKAALHLIGRR